MTVRASRLEEGLDYFPSTGVAVDNTMPSDTEVEEEEEEIFNAPTPPVISISAVGGAEE